MKNTNNTPATKNEIREAIAVLDSTLIKLNGQKADLPYAIRSSMDMPIQAIKNQIAALRAQFIAA